MGALAFGHLPVIFVPGGPMPSGLPNPEKSRIRQLYAEGKVGRAELLRAESESYHAPGTCTFYGTANSNQMLMEAMGLHLPGAAFVNPGTPLRAALTRAATHRAAQITAQGNDYRPMGEIIDERAVVNAIATLVATGGSTNHTIHLVAMAAIAGIHIDWTDISDISRATPLLARVYPNGQADVNHFQAAGGTGFVIDQLLATGRMHGDVETVVGKGLAAYAREPWMNDGRLDWRDAPKESGDRNVLRPANDPFDSEGGIRLLTGNLGRSIIKVSAVKPQHRVVRAPAAIFDDQDKVLVAFKEGKLHRDAIVVVRGQGPRANGMPELHKLTPALGVLQDLGYKVALVTDGRMSGASGKVPAAIHVSPEAAGEGPDRQAARGRRGLAGFRAHDPDRRSAGRRVERPRAMASRSAQVGVRLRPRAVRLHAGARDAAGAGRHHAAGSGVTHAAETPICWSPTSAAPMPASPSATGRARCMSCACCSAPSFPKIDEAIAAYFAELKRPRPTQACFAVACPAKGAEIKLTNSLLALREGGTAAAISSSSASSSSTISRRWRPRCRS